MAKTQTKAWDIADHLKTEADIMAYLDAALEEGDASLQATHLHSRHV